VATQLRASITDDSAVKANGPRGPADRFFLTTTYRPGVAALPEGPHQHPRAGAQPTKESPIMELIYRRSRRLGRRSRINYGTGGASVSYRLGPLTVNSRGRVSLRLGRGLSWRSGR
jgi:hypothetical protein